MLKVPMAIFAGATGSGNCINVGVFLPPHALIVLAAVLDHLDDSAPDPDPKLGEDPVRGIWCDTGAVSNRMAL